MNSCAVGNPIAFGAVGCECRNRKESDVRVDVPEFVARDAEVVVSSRRQGCDDHVRGSNELMKFTTFGAMAKVDIRDFF
tara:strand:+ start:424 stop:660 length:237 start_codon:yes stop_codon:yes gene_type:complete